MPADIENTSPAPIKRRARKISGAAPAKLPRKPRIAKTSAPASAASTPIEETPIAAPCEEKELTVIINGVPTPILPVTPREPASAEAHMGSRPATPVPADNAWHWVRSPLAATVAFLGALAVLLAGYWTGYNVAAGTAGETAVTIAEAAEIQPTAAAEPANAVVVTEEPEKIEMDARDLGTQPQAGLHLQVSALKSPSAASKLQRRLESHGFPVRVDPASDDSLVRVYVGPIEGKAELQTLTSELKKEGLEPFPKRL